jgi:hypothetical protein
LVLAYMASDDARDRSVAGFAGRMSVGRNVLINRVLTSRQIFIVLRMTGTSVRSMRLLISSMSEGITTWFMMVSQLKDCFDPGPA